MPLVLHLSNHSLKLLLGIEYRACALQWSVFEEVITLALAQEDMPAPMMQIATKDGSVIIIGGNHYLMASSSLLLLII